MAFPRQPDHLSIFGTAAVKGKAHAAQFGHRGRVNVVCLHDESFFDAKPSNNGATGRDHCCSLHRHGGAWWIKLTHRAERRIQSQREAI